MSIYLQKLNTYLQNVMLKYYLLAYAGYIIISDVVLFRLRFRDGFCRSKGRLDGKTVVITGGETGIGKETVRELSQRGARIVLGSLDYDTAIKTAAEITAETGNDLVVHKLDLGSLQSVRNFARKVLETEQEIHVLINNAAMCVCPKWRTEDGFEMQLGVNYLGHFLLTNLLLRRLKDSAPARIINLSSGSHYGVWINFDDLFMTEQYSPHLAYFQSKLAIVMASQELAEKIKGTGVSVYCVDPGVTGQTRVTKHVAQSYSLIMRPLVWFTYLFMYLAKTPYEGCQTTVYCAVDETAGQQTGLYYRDCLPTTPSSFVSDKKARAMLWDVAAKLVNPKIGMDNH